MFGWFAPKCPIGTWEKTWTEWRMRWLADQFGIDRLLKAHVLVPTEESFPMPFRGTAEDAQRVMNWLCHSMDVECGRLRLEMVPDLTMRNAVGQYEQEQSRAIIRVAESQLGDPQMLAATLAHELAHELLLGGGLLAPDAPDHEYVTDLLPVFLGTGIFAANTTVQESHQRDGRSYWWSIGKQGYLPARMFGYAFALFAFLRGEEKPAWVEYLRPDAAEPFWKGLRYLYRTNDSLFHPETVRAERRPAPADEVVSRLRQGTPSARLAALWELREHPLPRAEVVAAITDALRDRDPDIPGEAALTLAAFGDAAAEAVPALVGTLLAGNEAARAGAAHALGELRLRPDIVVPGLCELLGQQNRRVLAATASALFRFGHSAEPAAAPLVAALADALKDCDHPMIDLLAATVAAVSPDPARPVLDYEERDEELGREALEAVKEAAARNSPAG